MSSFLSDTYDKPKLVDSRVIKKVIIENKTNTTIENKIKTFIIDFIKKNYKVIILILIIGGGLFWRYNETKKKKKNDIQKPIYSTSLIPRLTEDSES